MLRRCYASCDMHHITNARRPHAYAWRFSIDSVSSTEPPCVSMRTEATLRGGKREMEDGAFILHRFDPDSASVGFDNAAADGEADAGAGDFAAVQAFEGEKNQIVIGGIDAAPVIADADDHLARIFTLGANLHFERNCG